MRREDWHAHPMTDEPPRFAFWAVAIAGGIVGALVLWSAVVVLIALLGGPTQ